MLIAARNLAPGSYIDVPEDVVRGTDNECCGEFEYAEVEQVDGGWADSAAPEGHVVIYTTNYALPIVINGDREIEVVITKEDS